MPLPRALPHLLRGDLRGVGVRVRAAARLLAPSCVALAFVATLLGGAPGTLWPGSAAGEARAQSRPSEAPLPTAPCLGEDIARRGVQKLPFLKRRRIEIVPQGGWYASDLISSSYTVGGAVAFFLTEGFGVEASYATTPIRLDVDDALTGFFGDTRFERGTGHLLAATLVWSPIHFKVRTSGGGIVYGDILFSLGAGKQLHESVQGLGFIGGAAMELYLTKWLSLRTEVRNVMLVQEVVAETRYTNNISTTLGLGLWFPFGF